MTLRTVRYDDAAWQLVPKTMARALFECAEALRDLLQDTQHVEHECDDEVFCPVKNGHAALARLDGDGMTLRTKMTPAAWLGAWAAALANAPEPPPAQEPTTPDRYQALRDALEHEYSVFQQWAFRSAADHATIAALLKERDALRAAIERLVESADRDPLQAVGLVVGHVVDLRAVLADGEEG